MKKEEFECQVCKEKYTVGYETWRGDFCSEDCYEEGMQRIREEGEREDREYNAYVQSR